MLKISENISIIKKFQLHSDITNFKEKQWHWKTNYPKSCKYFSQVAVKLQTECIDLDFAANSSDKIKGSGKRKDSRKLKSSPSSSTQWSSTSGIILRQYHSDSCQRSFTASHSSIISRSRTWRRVRKTYLLTSMVKICSKHGSERKDSRMTMVSRLRRKDPNKEWSIQMTCSRVKVASWTFASWLTSREHASTSCHLSSKRTAWMIRT